MQGLKSEDSGWYWCVADGYQSGLFVQVIRNTPTTVSNTPVTATITPATVSNTPVTATTPAATMNTTPQGNADQLSIYQTYDSRWSDQQVTQLNLQLEKLGKS